MDYYGQLHCINGEETFTHVPDWYRYEREETNKEVENGTYYVQILNCNTVEKEITVTKDEMVTVLEAEFETKRVKYNEMINLSKKLKKPCF